MWGLLFSSWQPQARKDYALLLSFVGQARLQFAGLHSLFLALWCIVIEIGKVMRDLLFWYQMYLYSRFICLCRCSFGSWCICNPLIFAVADALFLTNVSATCFSSNLQILLSLPVMYNCICILPFLGFKDTPFANFASTSHIFDNVKMLPGKITHPQLALSMLCGCSHQNFASSIPYRRYRCSISFELLFSSLGGNTFLTKNWYKNSCSDSMSEWHIRA